MDILILIVLLVGAVAGFVQGAFKQIASLMGVMVGIVLAIALYDKFGNILSSATGTSDGVGHIFAFVLIAVVVPLLLGWLASLLTKVCKAVHLNFLNRLAGAAIGIFGYGVLLSFVFNFMDFTVSNGGLHPEKLEERGELFYVWKHAAQPLVPDILIVTDAKEEALVRAPMRGVRIQLPAILGGE